MKTLLIALMFIGVLFAQDNKEVKAFVMHHSQTGNFDENAMMVPANEKMNKLGKTPKSLKDIKNMSKNDIKSVDEVSNNKSNDSLPKPRVKFIDFNDPPVPLKAIRPKYPKAAKEAGIEGTVYIQFFINKKGIVTEAWVLKGIPNTGLNESALEAVKKSKWKPAQQRDKKVGVWQTVPVKFELSSQ